MSKFTINSILALLILIQATACSAQTKAPSDQVIEGVFEITNEWQTITFEEPLTSIPTIQVVELLYCNEQMSFLIGDPDNPVPEKYKGYFIRTKDNQLFKPEVIISIEGKAYTLPNTGIGSYHSGQFKGCLSIHYSLEGKGNAFILPEGISIESVSIRSNLEIPIDFLYWVAPYFERAPNAKWSTTHPSRIIDLNDLPE